MFNGEGNFRIFSFKIPVCLDFLYFGIAFTFSLSLPGLNYVMPCKCTESPELRVCRAQLSEITFLSECECVCLQKARAV